MRSELPKWSDSSVSECESTATFESGLGTSYDTSLVKPVEVSYVLVGSEHDNIRCNSQETGSRIKRMLLFFRQKYANTAVPPSRAYGPPPPPLPTAHASSTPSAADLLPLADGRKPDHGLDPGNVSANHCLRPRLDCPAAGRELGGLETQQEEEADPEEEGIEAVLGGGQGGGSRGRSGRGEAEEAGQGDEEEGGDAGAEAEEEAEPPLPQALAETYPSSSVFRGRDLWVDPARGVHEEPLRHAGTGDGQGREQD